MNACRPSALMFHCSLIMCKYPTGNVMSDAVGQGLRLRHLGNAICECANHYCHPERLRQAGSDAPVPVCRGICQAKLLPSTDGHPTAILTHQCSQWVRPPRPPGYNLMSSPAPLTGPGSSRGDPCLCASPGTRVPTPWGTPPSSPAAPYPWSASPSSATSPWPRS